VAETLLKVLPFLCFLDFSLLNLLVPIGRTAQVAGAVWEHGVAEVL
jgi:hypothetical protein